MGLSSRLRPRDVAGRPTGGRIHRLTFCIVLPPVTIRILGGGLSNSHGMSLGQTARRRLRCIGRRFKVR